MCIYSHRCQRDWCQDERHHWLEIKVRHGPISKAEACELTIYRAEEQPS